MTQIYVDWLGRECFPKDGDEIIARKGMHAVCVAKGCVLMVTPKHYSDVLEIIGGDSKIRRIL